MHKWLALIGVSLVLYAFVSLVLPDYLPVDLGSWFAGLVSNEPPKYYKVVPGGAGSSLGWPALILGVIFIAVARVVRAKNGSSTP